MENIDAPWTIIKSYYNDKHLEQLVKHQIESYNYFVSDELPKTISMFNPVLIHSEHDYVKSLNKYKLDISINFENFHVFRPQIHENNGAINIMFPQDARLRNFTYASNITVDLNIKYNINYGKDLECTKVIENNLKNIHIGKLPIMLKSDICILKQYKNIKNSLLGECDMDAGGYFIINGSEKTCISQERPSENMIQCFNVDKRNNKWSWIAEIRSVPIFKSISPKQITLLIGSKNNGFGNNIFIQIPRINTPIPLFILFRALGILTDKDICKYIVYDLKNDVLLNLLRASILDANKYMSQEECIDYISKYSMYTPINMDKEEGIQNKKKFTINVINNDLFPHCRTKEQKIYFLGYMTNKLLKCSIGLINQSDRDSYLNKRIDTTGVLLNNLFRNYFNKLVKDMQKQVVREINIGSWKSTDSYNNIINMTNIYKIIKSSTIETGLKRALATGDFGIKYSNSNKVGVAQVLNRLTYISTLSHLRRINTPIDKSGKLIPPRKLHNTTWGYLCPAETPEGASVGIVKNLSYMAYITTVSNSEILYEYIEPYIIDFNKIEKDMLLKTTKIFINGNWIGNTRRSYDLYYNLKNKKLKGIINIFTSIVFNMELNEINILNGSGRLTRPLLIVKNNKLLLKAEHIKKLNNNELCWDDLLLNLKIDDAVIEYIDASEQNNSLIAMTYKDLIDGKNYTHCEIHPSTIFGILASCIPFPEHNQSPRNTYQCAMGKQAMGMYVTNYDNRMDKTGYVLTYPMRPMVETRIMNILKLDKIPSGSQVIVAIMTHTGYNQEDSILFNKASIDRGLFQATIYKTEKDEDKKINGDGEIRCKPDITKTKEIKIANYNKVNNEGVVPVNTLLENKDIIISKVIPIKDARNDNTRKIKYQDKSIVYKSIEESYVDKNVINKNGDGYDFCKVRIRILRKPVIGDKFSSRHGQKGTIGNIIDEKDMPFTKDGLKPDIIINPHAIPSRMTIAQLKETLLGKVLIELGLFGDGTSFENFNISDICKILQNEGYESNGNQILYNGLTGEQLETSIFIGPVFYQRLKHMVIDKTHSRSYGPKVNLTRQPAEGRTRSGGLRYGEMERDCMCSHGASRFNKERLYDVSDSFSVHTCNKCGMISAYNDKKHIHLCTVCNNTTDFSKVNIPYACKLLFQELLAMNIAPRIITK
jgi:DNA-directed RNA polymerase II subunit RPB2